MVSEKIALVTTLFAEQELMLHEYVVFSKLWSLPSTKKDILMKQKGISTRVI